MYIEITVFKESVDAIFGLAIVVSTFWGENDLYLPRFLIRLIVWESRSELTLSYEFIITSASWFTNDTDAKQGSCQIVMSVIIC